MTAEIIPHSVQAVGECMVEVWQGRDGQVRMGYSGDSYNTAVYLARMSRALEVPHSVHYLTGVGIDDQSRLMRSRWRDEGIRDDALEIPGASPGLYVITTDEHGERSFAYWRADSAAARVFQGNDWVDRVNGELIYFSGISLQLMGPQSREAFLARLQGLRASGSRVAFDSNYRPSGWSSAAEARCVMDRFAQETDIALVTLEDEIALGGCADVEGCVRALASHGVAEIVVKDGVNGAWLSDGASLTHVPVATRVLPVDTTAAGDSFNGGYLAARSAGRTPRVAAGIANTLASRVVAHPGAILDLEQMPGGWA